MLRMVKIIICFELIKVISAGYNVYHRENIYNKVYALYKIYFVKWKILPPSIQKKPYFWQKS